MEQLEISDLTVNSCSLSAVQPAVITNSSIQNKRLKGEYAHIKDKKEFRIPCALVWNYLSDRPRPEK